MKLSVLVMEFCSLSLLDYLVSYLPALRRVVASVLIRSQTDAEPACRNLYTSFNCACGSFRLNSCDTFGSFDKTGIQVSQLTRVNVGIFFTKLAFKSLVKLLWAPWNSCFYWFFVIWSLDFITLVLFFFVPVLLHALFFFGCKKPINQ